MGGTKETVKPTTGTTTGNDKNGTDNTKGAVTTKAKVNDSVYPASELAYNAKKLFNTMPECVTAALKMADVKECTIDEAKTLVKNFLNQEV